MIVWKIHRNGEWDETMPIIQFARWCANDDGNIEFFDDEQGGGKYLISASIGDCVLSREEDGEKTLAEVEEIALEIVRYDCDNQNAYRFGICEEKEIPGIIYREMTAGNDITNWIREAVDLYYDWRNNN